MAKTMAELSLNPCFRGKWFVSPKTKKTMENKTKVSAFDQNAGRKALNLMETPVGYWKNVFRKALPEDNMFLGEEMKYLFQIGMDISFIELEDYSRVNNLYHIHGRRWEDFISWRDLTYKYNHSEYGLPNIGCYNYKRAYVCAHDGVVALILNLYGDIYECYKWAKCPKYWNFIYEL